jgi:hypothetical protein
MFPKAGKVFPRSGGPTGTHPKYADVVAAALKSKLGNTHQATKTVMKWTGANERTAKHWIRGDVGPNGDHLLDLIRQCPDVLQAILRACGWGDPVLLPVGESEMRVTNLGEMLATANRSQGLQKVAALNMYASPRQACPESGPKNVPDRGPSDVPDTTTQCEAEALALNGRQQWFLLELRQRRYGSLRDICMRFGVSARTAKRDVAGLKVLGLLRFVGTRRNGRFEL